ncbi:hypothetical protein ACWM9A_15275 [Acetobacter pasteurianus]
MEKTLIAPAITHEESQRRRRAVEEARAANFRQGYRHDVILEEANDADFSHLRQFRVIL